MSLIKTPEEIEIMREGCRRLAVILDKVIAAACPGATEKELDQLAEELIRAGGDTPAFKDYQPEGASIPFPATVCISVNEAIVHGIPTSRPLEDGDIVGLDLGLQHKGLFADMAMTVAIGTVSEESKKLMRETALSLDEGIKAAKGGNRIGDIGAAIESVATRGRYGVVRELGGHGIGRKLHEEPHVPNYGSKGRGLKLVPGMVLALEPMFNIGTEEIVIGEDQYKYNTADGSRSAHFEKTILITEGEAEVLTQY